MPEIEGFEAIQGTPDTIHNAGVPGSSPGVATNLFKGLASARPFFISRYAHIMPTLCPALLHLRPGGKGHCGTKMIRREMRIAHGHLDV